MRRAALGLVVALAVLIAPGFAQAANEQIVIKGDVNVARGEVASDVVVASGDVNIAGTVTNDVVAFSGKIRVSGTVEGDLVALSEPIVLTRGARVDGDVIYGAEPPIVAPGARVGGEQREFDQSDLGSEIGQTALVLGVLLLIGLALSTLLIGLVLLWLFPRAADSLLAPANDRIGRSIGWGVALSFGLPILAILLLITVIGIPVGGFILLALLPLYAVGHVTSQWLLGRTIVKAPRARWVSFLAGWAILNVAALVPFLGALVGLAATVFGLGVLAVTASQAGGAGPPPATPTPAPAAGPPSGGAPVPPPPPA